MDSTCGQRLGRYAIDLAMVLPAGLIYLLMGESSGFVLLMKTLIPTLLVGILWFGLADEIKYRLNLYNKSIL